MKINVHFNNVIVDFKIRPSSSSDGGRKLLESWAQAMQHFVEQALVCSPHLLPLLASLTTSLTSMDSRAASQAGNGRYVLHYGDGYATDIYVTWSNHDNNSSMDDGGEFRGEAIEANLSFKPRNVVLSECCPLDNIPMIEPNEILDVDLIVEIIGFETEGTGHFPMTQLPFYIDPTKMNLMRLLEHTKFRGVVHQRTLEPSWIASSVGASAKVWGVNSKASAERYGAGSKDHARPEGMQTSVSKVLESTTSIASVRKDNSGEKKMENYLSSKTVRSLNKGGDQNEVTKSTTKKKSKSNSKSVTSSSSSSSSAQPTGANNEMVSSAVTAVSKSPIKKAVRKKDGADFKVEPDSMSPPNKRTKRSNVEPASKKTGEEMMMNAKGKPSVVTLSKSPPPDSKRDDDDSEEEVRDNNAVDAAASVNTVDENNRQNKKPKRPLTPFLLFSNDARQRVKEANPELNANEITSLLSKEYKSLDDGTKKRYQTEYDNSVVRYKEEFGDDSMNRAPRSTASKVGDSEKAKNKQGSGKGGVGADIIPVGDEKANSSSDVPSNNPTTEQSEKKPHKKKRRKPETGVAEAASENATIDDINGVNDKIQELQKSPKRVSFGNAFKKDSASGVPSNVTSKQKEKEEEEEKSKKSRKKKNKNRESMNTTDASEERASKKKNTKENEEDAMPDSWFA